MDTFYNLINQIASLDEEVLEDLEKSYDNLFGGMVNNYELINETRHAMIATGIMKPEEIIKEKEGLHTLIEHIKETGDLSERKIKLITQIEEIVVGIYDKVLETAERDIVNIAVELCREDAKLPTYAHAYDAGFDIYLPEDFTIKAHEYGKIAPTGLKMAIPTGYELQIRPRSGNSVKTTLRIANAPGTIDCGYCDEIGIICDNIGDKDLEFKKGDRIAQGILAISPKGIFNQVEDILKVPGSNRGGGYGSTGK